MDLTRRHTIYRLTMYAIVLVGLWLVASLLSATMVVAFMGLCYKFGSDKTVFGYKWSHICDPLRWFYVLASAIDPTRHPSIGYCEQILFRAHKCKGCLANGQCVQCKCVLPASMENPELGCSREEWDPVLGDTEWNAQKVQWGINFSLTQERPYPEVDKYDKNHL